MRAQVRSGRLAWLFGALALVAGCFGGHSSGDDTPPPPPSGMTCSQACSDACPGGETCSAGFCAAAGETCEPTFAHVSAGTGLGCALDTLSRLWCWGDNAHRAIVDSDRRVVERAVIVGDRRWDTVAVGNGDVCALASGALWCWGSNERNQIQLGLPADVVAPVQIKVAGGPATWTQVVPALDHTCAIGDGRLFCWGGNASGVLGTGDVNDRGPFEVDPAITDWSAVASSSGHTCASSRSHGVACWGDGSNGELGTGNFTVEYDPQPTGVMGAEALAAGVDSTCAITIGRALQCWGRAADGSLGDPAVVSPGGGAHASAVSATPMFGWTQLAAGEHYACGLRGDEVWCWGHAVTGGIGDGHWAPAQAWVQVASHATELSVGWNASAADRGLDAADRDLSCAVIDGKIQCWGDARTAQIAGGGVTFAPTPVEVTGGHTWSALAAGPAHVCGISDGTTYCWGSTERGQITGLATGRAVACVRGVPCDAGAPAAVTTSATAIAPGGGHTCALRGAALTCWGDSTSGQCGAVSSLSQPPADLAGTWSQVFAGANGSCGVRGGETWCWGSVVTQHAPAHEPALDGAQAIALGAAFGCALDATGKLACFGDPGRAGFGNGGAGTCGDAVCNHSETATSCPADCGPAPLTHLARPYTAIAVGQTGSFACGLRADGHVECWGDNQRGQAGAPDPAIGVRDPVTTPFELPLLAGCTAIAAGGSHACAVCNGGEVDCWGDDQLGQLGAGPLATLPQPAPRKADIALPGDPFVAVTAGGSFTCARTQRGRAFCWGTSPHGALGTGATAANLPTEIKHD